MTILKTVYASAPTSEVIIPSLEIQVPGVEPIRIFNGFQCDCLGNGLTHNNPNVNIN